MVLRNPARNFTDKTGISAKVRNDKKSNEKMFVYYVYHLFLYWYDLGFISFLYLCPNEQYEPKWICSNMLYL